MHTFGFAQNMVSQTLGSPPYAGSTICEQVLQQSSYIGHKVAVVDELYVVDVDGSGVVVDDSVEVVDSVVVDDCEVVVHVVCVSNGVAAVHQRSSN
jgi:NDP-sugar pyrophosphorylase family protein